MAVDRDAFTRAGALLRQAMDSWSPVAVLTGAGISAESGVPTFRGPDGLWCGFRPEELATPAAFARHPERVWEWYHWRRRLVLAAMPNAGHRALAALEAVAGDAFTLVTQNVDGLHRLAGSRRLVELHGTLLEARCTRCGRVEPLPPEATGIPRCPACGAMARPNVVWFGESLPADAWARAQRAAETASVFLVIGTSAVVYPAAGLIEIAAASGARVIEVNPEETPLSGLADCVLRERAGVALPALLREAGILDA